MHCSLRVASSPWNIKDFPSHLNIHIVYALQFLSRCLTISIILRVCSRKRYYAKFFVYIIFAIKVLALCIYFKTRAYKTSLVGIQLKPSTIVKDLVDFRFIYEYTVYRWTFKSLLPCLVPIIKSRFKTLVTLITDLV